MLLMWKNGDVCRSSAFVMIPCSFVLLFILNALFLATLHPAT
jgi:hypothetical protein